MINIFILGKKLLLIQIYSSDLTIIGFMHTYDVKFMQIFIL